MIPQPVNSGLVECMNRLKEVLENETKYEDDVSCCFTKRDPVKKRVTNVGLTFMRAILIPCESEWSRHSPRYSNISIDTNPPSMESFVNSITKHRRYKLTLRLSNLFTRHCKDGHLSGKVFLHCIQIKTRDDTKSSPSPPPPPYKQ
jgi:hypothetical protein